MKVGIFGTFDVENYGDLLFPMIAEHELKSRFDTVQLIRYSYNSKTTKDWPYDVTSISDLHTASADLDGIIIGGGHIIRFDQGIAPSYFPPQPISHPIAYWLTPAIAGITAGIPVVWNAPSASVEMLAWQSAALGLALTGSQYVSVRDVQSKDIIVGTGYTGNINIVPDTAFGIKRIFSSADLSMSLNKLLVEANISRPYIVVQPIEGLKEIVHQFLQLCDFNIDIISIPIGPVLGDNTNILASASNSNKIKSFERWLKPSEIAAIVSGSSAVLAQSLHLSITAIAFDKVVIRNAKHNKGKYQALDSSNLVRYTTSGAQMYSILSEVLASTEINSESENTDKLLKTHWDDIASVLKQPGTRRKLDFKSANTLFATFDKMLNDRDEGLEQLKKQNKEDERRILELLEAERHLRDVIRSMSTGRASLQRTLRKISSRMFGPKI